MSDGGRVTVPCRHLGFGFLGSRASFARQLNLSMFTFFSPPGFVEEVAHTFDYCTLIEDEQELLVSCARFLGRHFGSILGLN